MAQSEQQGMTYAGVGVDYDYADVFKRMAQERGAQTVGNVKRLGIEMLEWTRGESTCLFSDRNGDIHGHVNEGLGTKQLVADAMYKLTTIAWHYGAISQDTVAAIVNDAATLGISPGILAMNLAVGSSEWFKDKKRSLWLISGWKKACDMAGCVWGLGETPVLKDVIFPETFVLSGSVSGIRKIVHSMNPSLIRSGDSIVFLESSGIEANGLTLAREIAKKLPDGYLTPLPDGRLYGDVLLEPAHIYCMFVEACLDAGIDIHYAVNITGHGWRKLMRATQPFAYVVEAVPKVPVVLEFIQKNGPVDDKEAYGTFNMGAGFALYVPEPEVAKIMKLSKAFDFGAVYGGHIQKSDERKVIIKPKDIEYLGATLGVR